MKKYVWILALGALAGCFTSKPSTPEVDPAAEAAAARLARKTAFAERLATSGIVLLANEANTLPFAEGSALTPLALAEDFELNIALASCGLKVPLPPKEGEDGEVEEAPPEVVPSDRSVPVLVTLERPFDGARDLTDAPGSYRLSEEEDALLREACGMSDRVVVLLKTGGVVDTSFMDRYPIKALLYAPPLGEVSARAIAQILTGRVTPSGKTVDTWAKRYIDYPSTDCYGCYEVPYREGSSVGYRHFDSAGIAPRYPFGYGLSYTTFNVACGTAKCNGTSVSVPVTVRNTGARKGAEVVEAYLTRAGRDPQEEPVKRLCAFQKTRVLNPGATQTMRLAFDATVCAIFDEKSSSWVLPAGEYTVLVGTSSDKVQPAARFALPRTVVSSAVVSLKEGAAFARQAGEDFAEGPFEERVTLDDVRAGIATIDQVVAQFSDEELASLVLGGVTEEGRRVESAAEPERSVDWPCATAIAQGWDVINAEWFGRLMADDMVKTSVPVWPTPSVAIHRNPLDGRNAASYSEDPLLSGKMGAAVVRGVQLRADGAPTGRKALVSTFGTREPEAKGSEQYARIGEKALREIYLKPFEIIVKESNPWAVRMSRGRLNGTMCAEDARLVVGVLRNEWGFDGLVEAECGGGLNPVKAIAAGCDTVGGGAMDAQTALAAALSDGSVVRGDVQKSASRLLSTTLSL